MDGGSLGGWERREAKEEVAMGLAGEDGKVGRCGQILEDLPWSLL